MPWLPRTLFKDWPEDASGLETKKVVELYQSGFAGAKYSEEAVAEFRATHRWPNAEDAAHHFGLADTGAGKLVIPYVHVLEMFPGCWPGRQGQARGDCVSWNTRNAALLTMVCDIVSGQPDEKTGKAEGPPEVPAEGVADGVLSTETFYWYRGYDGDGWHCPSAANVACRKSGLMVRKNYPEFGVDLTTYSGQKAGLYGRRAPGPEIQRAGSEHLIHQATEASTFEAVRDFLFNGYGISTCGSEGLSDTRDANGVSRRQGSWAHAMAYIAVDDRPVIHRLYGEGLVLDLNSWAKWNRGPRDIVESAQFVPPDKKDLWVSLGIVNPATGNIMIPEGSCWVRWSEMQRREHIALSGANGWPRKALPDYGTTIWG
jgi:hypothetical protein